MTQQKVPLLLRYTVPGLDGEGEQWQREGMPLGNGSLGATLWGGVEEERILINEKSLWSGGPGADPAYDGGVDHTYTAEQTHGILQTLRQRLQDIAADFTASKAAFRDETGRVVARDYGISREGRMEDPETQRLIEALRGQKDRFGSYQMLSDLRLTYRKGEYTDYLRQLDLRRGIASVTYRQAGVRYTREYLTSFPAGVLALRITADRPGAVDCALSVTTLQQRAEITADGDCILMIGQPADQREEGLRFAQAVRVAPTGGKLVSAPGGIAVTGADELLILLAAGTNYRPCTDASYDYFTGEDPLPPVRRRTETAALKGWETLAAEHIADYGALFSRVELAFRGATLPEKDTSALLAGYKDGSNTGEEDRYLEQLYYQFGRYLLISSSREGSLPANLQGIWADGLNPPWSADYHTNINLQMNYWPAEQTNLPECHLPVIDYVKGLVPRGTALANHYYCRQDGGPVRGWTVGHENNPWGNAAPGNWYWGYYFPAAAAWMCQDIWEHFAFTGDKEFLRANFDIMLGAALFWVDNLWTDSRDGTLVANPSYSPEHGPYSLGCSCDQEIVWELFEEIRKSAAVLGLDTAEIREVAAAQKRLYLPKIGLGGEYLEWKDETALDLCGDGGHRHVNHLYALHPGTLVVAGRSGEDDRNLEAMKQVLRTRGDGGTGWSKAWKINFWARLREGDHAALMLGEQLKESTLQNLFDTHPPFQIDGNFGATAGMTEMLLQSQGDTLDLLAALPSRWPAGKVTGLKARGNFTVDMEWEGGKLTAARITAPIGGTCALRYPGVAAVTCGGAALPVTRQGDICRFETIPGGIYEITLQN